MTAIEVSTRPHFSPAARVPATTVHAFMSPSDQHHLSMSQCLGVLNRNQVFTVAAPLDDGQRRFTRERYSSAGSGIYVAPTGSLLAIARTSESPRVECDVSEVEGLRSWRYVTLIGTATLLQPTGSEAERNEWKTGIEQLRSAIPGLPDTNQLQFENFGIVRVDRIALFGSVVRLDEAEQPLLGAVLE